MKVYIVTSLIENQDEGAEVNIIGVEKTLEEAKNLMQEVLEQAKEMYEENNFEYDVEEYDDTIVISADNDYERIEYNMFEEEI